MIDVYPVHRQMLPPRPSLISASVRLSCSASIDDALITVATDGGAMYPSERAKTIAQRYRGEYSHTDAAEAFGRHLGSTSTEHMIDMTEADRRRIFQLGYYTWVEQQGTPFEMFELRRSQDFWRGLRRYVGVWDEMITDLNGRIAAAD